MAEDHSAVVQQVKPLPSERSRPSSCSSPDCCERQPLYFHHLPAFFAGDTRRRLKSAHLCWLQHCCSLFPAAS